MAILERVGGVAAALTVVFLVLGLVGLVIEQKGLGLRNWLVVLLQMNSGFGSLPSDPLRVSNLLDVVVLALVGLTFLGLWPIVGRQHRIWTAIAIALPFVGIPLLLVSGLQGRSAVMGAGIVISVLMFVSGNRTKLLVSIGLFANALLLAGDFGTGVLPGGPVAVAVAIGYVSLLGWYVLLAVNLLGQRQTTGG
jgi:hypothetical protein